MFPESRITRDLGIVKNKFLKLRSIHAAGKQFFISTSSNLRNLSAPPPPCQGKIIFQTNWGCKGPVRAGRDSASCAGRRSGGSIAGLLFQISFPYDSLWSISAGSATINLQKKLKREKIRNEMKKYKGSEFFVSLK